MFVIMVTISIFALTSLHDHFNLLTSGTDKNSEILSCRSGINERISESFLCMSASSTKNDSILHQCFCVLGFWLFVRSRRTFEFIHYCVFHENIALAMWSVFGVLRCSLFLWKNSNFKFVLWCSFSMRLFTALMWRRLDPCITMMASTRCCIGHINWYKIQAVGTYHLYLLAWHENAIGDRMLGACDLQATSVLRVSRVGHVQAFVSSSKMSL